MAHWCAHAQEDLLTELWAALRRFNKAIDLCRWVAWWHCGEGSLPAACVAAVH